VAQDDMNKHKYIYDKNTNQIIPIVRGFTNAHAKCLFLTNQN